MHAAIFYFQKRFYGQDFYWVCHILYNWLKVDLQLS